MNYCFVILHYLTADDTIECINSIVSVSEGKNSEIVIVDNYSNNGSIEKVQEHINKFDNCVIIKNTSNLGFARGNNVGYKYAKHKYKDPFIIVLNNDTIIRQNDFLKKIEKKYCDEKFALLGPDIISLVDGGHQNPLGKVPTKRLVRIQILKYSILYILSKLGLYKLVQDKTGKVNKKEKKEPKSFEAMEIKNIALHGSCLVFSPIFVRTMNEAFCPDTFLYKEEFILAKRCEKMQLKMIYDPEIKIFHKEDSSTNVFVRTKKEKREFVFKNLIRSNRILLKFL